jgi:ssDNA-binding Zn-finger/Zn-ribbon topoisomerase 1
MLDGKCPKCAYHCSGWALQFPQNQTCPRCGTGLVITEGGRKISTGYSPFTAEKYVIDAPAKTPTPIKKKSGEQDKPPRS